MTGYLTEAESVLIPYGLLNDRLVTPEEAPRGLSNVTCLQCDGLLIAAQGEIVRPYFRHQSGVDHLCDYTGETVKHKLAKITLAGRLRKAISDKEEVTFQWTCRCHNGYHEGNLVKSAISITADDKKVGLFLPDIGIFDESKCRVFLEIHVTHNNSQEKIDYCKAKGISLVTIDLARTSDPVDFVRKSPLPAKSDVCLYYLGSKCKCRGRKPAKTDSCINCLRKQRGIDIDIAGSHRTISPRIGTWAAIVTDADGTQTTYASTHLEHVSNLPLMLRRALLTIAKEWQSAYTVRVHSTSSLVESRSGRHIFRLKAKQYTYPGTRNRDQGTKLRKPLERATQLAKIQYQREKTPPGHK